MSCLKRMTVFIVWNMTIISGSTIFKNEMQALNWTLGSTSKTNLNGPFRLTKLLRSEYHFMEMRGEDLKCFVPCATLQNIKQSQEQWPSRSLAIISEQQSHA